MPDKGLVERIPISVEGRWQAQLKSVAALKLAGMARGGHPVPGRCE